MSGSFLLFCVYFAGWWMEKGEKGEKDLRFLFVEPGSAVMSLARRSAQNRWCNCNFSRTSERPSLHTSTPSSTHNDTPLPRATHLSSKPVLSVLQVLLFPIQNSLIPIQKVLLLLLPPIASVPVTECKYGPFL